MMDSLFKNINEYLKYYFVLSTSVLVKRTTHMCDEFHLKIKGGQKNQKTEPNQSKKN